jgi:anti-sigma factor RsiW
VHLGDGLSAFVDGELIARDHADAEAHLAECPDCRTELAAVRAARLAIRTLPGIDPPIDLVALAGVPRPQRVARRPARLAPALTAVAAGLVIAVTGSHPATYVQPATLIGYRRVTTVTVRDGVQVVYRRGANQLSLHQARGRLDRSAMPAQAVRLSIGGGVAWGWDHPAGGSRVVVLRLDGLVVTVVGDESPEAVRAAAEALPGPPAPGLVARLRHATARALGHLGPAP